MGLRSIAGKVKRGGQATWSQMRGRPPGLNGIKIDAIDAYWREFSPATFADLGGVWAVDGGYAFRAAGKSSTRQGYLVDTDFTPAVHARLKSSPKLKLINRNFGDPAVVNDIGAVDVVFLFDTLLHQVAPNWDEILAMYAPITRGFIIYNQQWVSSKHTVRLLDLGEERYMSAVPSAGGRGPYENLFGKLDDVHPQHGRKWRDVHNIWQWGITDADVMRVLDGLGFKLQLFRNCGQFGRLKDFENHLFVYTRA